MGPEANITIMTKQSEKEVSTDGADDGGLADVCGLVVDIEGGGPLEVGLDIVCVGHLCCVRVCVKGVCKEEGEGVCVEVEGVVVTEE